MPVCTDFETPGVERGRLDDVRLFCSFEFLAKRGFRARDFGRIVISPSSSQPLRLEPIFRLEPLGSIKSCDSTQFASRRFWSVN